MPQNNTQGKCNATICTARLDRTQILARTWTKELPRIPGFDIARDSLDRRRTAIETYKRVRNLENRKTGSKLFLQYQPTPPWLEPNKVTIIADDFLGLTRSELETICEPFRWTKLLTVEFAMDFDNNSQVDRDFVLGHGVFGKSRLVGGRFFETLHYGGHWSDSLTRCYDKPGLQCYRVEIQLHSRWLRKHEITQPRHLSRLSSLLSPQKISFVTIDWDGLEEHLERTGRSSPILGDLRSRPRPLHRTLGLLRQELRLSNLHRFLTPLPINNTVKAAVKTWTTDWRNKQGEKR